MRYILSKRRPTMRPCAASEEACQIESALFAPYAKMDNTLKYWWLDLPHEPTMTFQERPGENAWPAAECSMISHGLNGGQTRGNLTRWQSRRMSSAILAISVHLTSMV